MRKLFLTAVTAALAVAAYPNEGQAQIVIQRGYAPSYGGYVAPYYGGPVTYAGRYATPYYGGYTQPYYGPSTRTYAPVYSNALPVGEGGLIQAAVNAAVGDTVTYSSPVVPGTWVDRGYGGYTVAPPYYWSGTSPRGTMRRGRR